MKVGGTNRKQTIEKITTALGGKIEAFYYAFGDHDVYARGEVPDEASLAALAMNINASGVVSVTTTILLSPEEIDQAIKISLNYRPPET
ncbi:MAG: GYD domain-containing protein [Ginsengibacter sp.]